MNKKYVRTLLIVLLALGIASHYTVRLNPSSRNPPSTPSVTPPAISNNTVVPALQPNSSYQQKPPASSEFGSQIRIESPYSSYSSQQPALILKLGIYDNDPPGNPPKASSAIDWSANGPIVAGQRRNSSRMYLKNEGNVPVTLSLSSSTWSFKDKNGNNLSQDYKQYFSLTWDYDNSVLQVNQVIHVIFTLTVRADIVDVAAFSFDLTVILTY